MLERAPRPGVRGALADFGTALAGTRQLARFTGGVCLLMPPATTLVTQLLLLLLTRNDHYCEVPLLQAPLTQQRVAALASALEYLTLPIRLLQPAASSPLRRGERPAGGRGRLGAPVRALPALHPPSSLALAPCMLIPRPAARCRSCAGTAPPVPVCRATLSFVQIALTVMAPVLVSVYSWRPPPQQSEQQRQQEAQASSSISSQGGIGRLCSQLSAHIAAGFDMANRALQLALYSPAGVDSRAVVCWWLLAVSWWLAKRSEGLY